MARKKIDRGAKIQIMLKHMITEARRGSDLYNIRMLEECGVKYRSLYEDYKEYIHKQANKKQI